MSPKYKKIFELSLTVSSVVALVMLSGLANKAIDFIRSRASSTPVIKFESGSYTLPSTNPIKIMVDSGGNQIGFVRAEVNFDTTKVRLSNDPVVSQIFKRKVLITSASSANSTGKLTIAVGLDPADRSNIPTGVFELAQLQFVPATTSANLSSTLSFNPSGMQVVATTTSPLTFTTTNSNLTINPTIANTVTPTPTQSAPSPVVSTTPAPTPIGLYNCTGPTVILTGTTDQYYRAGTVASGTTYDLRTWYSNTVGNTNSTAIKLGVDSGPMDLCVKRGVINGHIDLTWTWTQAHDYGGGGIETWSSRYEPVDFIRVHNVEDGWKPREYPEFSNTAIMQMANTYMTGIRDDAIENDNFIPGFITNSLFDGVHAFLSEQNQSGLSTPPTTIGPNEDQYIRISRTYVRLHPTNGGTDYLPGHWFKWQPRGAVNHKVIITDSVFATSTPSRGGWDNYNFPPNTQFIGTNYMLWLGTPGGFGGIKPSGITFLEGQGAVDKWNEVRNTWLVNHGYSPRPLDDFNPMDDPVVAPN